MSSAISSGHPNASGQVVSSILQGNHLGSDGGVRVITTSASIEVLQRRGLTVAGLPGQCRMLGRCGASQTQAAPALIAGQIDRRMVDGVPRLGDRFAVRRRSSRRLRFRQRYGVEVQALPLVHFRFGILVVVGADCNEG